jgi:DNA-binding transcriptional LysR family regulator|tara:strand:- start:86 stop:334 length:249 start_codon:yes stop_codon:yes gene_type:complete
MIWEKLNRFTNITKFKSLSEAARSGKMSQSTWSRDINQLEKTFGYRLVLRNYNGIRLTQKGENLLQLINSFKKNLKIFKSTN